jgi:hypothetical protein
MTWTRTLSTAVLVGFVAAAAHAQPSDPMLGTWKLNTAKSKSPYKSGTSTIEAAGDALKVTADLVGTDGTAYHWTWTAKPDGKDVPITGTTPYGAGATASMTRADAHTLNIVGKRNGDVILTQTVVTSADGKTRTLTTHAKDAKGMPVETTSFYDKQ